MAVEVKDFEEALDKVKELNKLYGETKITFELVYDEEIVNEPYILIIYYMGDVIHRSYFADLQYFGVYMGYAQGFATCYLEAFIYNDL